MHLECKGKKKKNMFKATEGNYFERNTFDLLFPLLARACVVKNITVNNSVSVIYSMIYFKLLLNKTLIKSLAVNGLRNRLEKSTKTTKLFQTSLF